MGEPLSAEEKDLAEEGLAAIEAGEIVRGDEVNAELAARHQSAGGASRSPDRIRPCTISARFTRSTGPTSTP